MSPEEWRFCLGTFRDLRHNRDQISEAYARGYRKLIRILRREFDYSRVDECLSTLIGFIPFECEHCASLCDVSDTTETSSGLIICEGCRESGDFAYVDGILYHIDDIPSDEEEEDREESRLIHAADYNVLDTLVFIPANRENLLYMGVE